MKPRSILSALASGLALGASAFAGVGVPDAYVSGLLHQGLNGAVVTEMTARRVRYCCIGSSGQDGVEVQLNSAWGGAVAVDIGHTFTPGSEIRIRPKGWDGTIKGTLRMTGNTSGGSTLTADFSDMGATGLHYEDYDANGNLTAQGEFPVGGIAMIPPCLNPPGSVPFWYFLATWNPNTQSWVFTLQYRCVIPGPPPDSSTERTIVLTPGLPPGIPVIGGLASLLVTGTDVGELELGDASLHTLGVECWGLGEGHLSESCDSPGGCPREDIALRVDNLGSSGQDGVAIDLGDDAGSLTFQRRRCPDCPPGHVTLIKLYDDDARVMMSAASSDNQSTGVTDLTLDYIGIDALEYEVVLYDEFDNEIGSAFVLSGLQAIAYHDACPPPGVATWYCQGFKCWLISCIQPMDFVLPGGTVVTGVARASFEPLGHTGSAAMRQCRVTGGGGAGGSIELAEVAVHSADGDMNCDGVADILDINPFVQALSDPAAYSAANPSCNVHHADVNDDGNIDVLDINPFIALLAGG